ncbi:MAG: 2-(hydroxymethyl)glutarate dehydrogenase [Alphaproteobacteria bacterium MarineAlpha11_Bin1]|nr:MAG: 2-(hydroxymethyl)glutarate dehydrogenase [Alphaproteobacteria bacterium MarineAlpha11_Bin1]
MTDIGFIGLGNMGAPLARRLLKDHTLYVWDLNPAAVQSVVAEGAIAANGPNGIAASGAQLIITCLPTSAQVEEVIFGSDGLKNNLSAGMLIADMTTGDPLVTKDMSTRLNEDGVSLIDAPVSGGVAGAEAGTIAIMIGAPADVFENVKPHLEAISPNIFHAGDIGAGHSMKLINNMISSCIRLATFEGLALATKIGIEPMRFSEILAKGSARGYIADTTLPTHIIPGRVEQGFGLALMHKDLTLATKLGQDMKAPLTTGNYAREVFRMALNELGEDVDISQIIRVFERAADVDVCEAQKRLEN